VRSRASALPAALARAQARAAGALAEADQAASCRGGVERRHGAA